MKKYRQRHPNGRCLDSELWAETRAAVSEEEDGVMKNTVLHLQTLFKVTLPHLALVSSPPSQPSHLPTRPVPIWASYCTADTSWTQVTKTARCLWPHSGAFSTLRPPRSISSEPQTSPGAGAFSFHFHFWSSLFWGSSGSGHCAHWGYSCAVLLKSSSLAQDLPRFIEQLYTGKCKHWIGTADLCCLTVFLPARLLLTNFAF